ncbi:MAG: hypothetical protein PVF58_18510 [Candidatus Methanofastidiosia archaeon]|jgi:hypothetical protein
MQEKNEVGFTEKHLKILLTYCKTIRKNPKLSYNTFHKEYHPYSRIQSTVTLINKAYKKGVVYGPLLYANVGIEVHLMDDIDNPSKFLEECKNDEKTTMAIPLRGEWSFIHFKYGASMLTYMDQILPGFYSSSNECIENLCVTKKGVLPIDLYPHGWSETHWKIYELMYSPRDCTFKGIGDCMGVHWKTVKKYFLEVLGHCKVLMSFFPLGDKGYSYHVVTFKTAYEVGILNALKKLDRTSYIFKVEDIIILGLFLKPGPKAHEKSTKWFTYLEEVGLIHDLHVSIPWDAYSKFV